MPVRELVVMVEPSQPPGARAVAAGLCYRDLLT
jgi:hypothetical protein